MAEDHVCSEMIIHDPSHLQALLIRDTTKLLLKNLLTQPPKVLPQLIIFGLFRGLRDFAIRYNLYGHGQRQ